MLNHQDQYNKKTLTNEDLLDGQSILIFILPPTLMTHVLDLPLSHVLMFAFLFSLFGCMGHVLELVLKDVLK